MLKRNRIKTFIEALTIAFVLGVFCFIAPDKAINAADNGKLDVKIVNSYDEMMEYIEGDDYFYLWDSFEPYEIEDGTWIYSKKIDELWSFEVKEQGWLFIFRYNNSDYNGKDLKSYVYSNKLLTKGIDEYLNYYSLSLNAEKYSYRECDSYYLTKGTYYLKLSTENARYTFNFLDYAIFLPCSAVCSVDNIGYNDDYSEAVVSMKCPSDSWDIVKFANRKNDSTDVLLSGSYWDKTYRYNWVEERENVNDILTNGLPIKENGEYSLYFQFDKGEYAGLPMIVNFSVDKIGQEANKIEAKSLKMSKTKATLKPKGTLQLKVTFKPKNVTDQTLTWKSSNSKVAKVDKNGKVTAKKKGTCVITAISSNGKKAKCKITVKK